MSVFCGGMGIFATNGKKKIRIADYQGHAWFCVRIVADISRGNYDLYLDGRQCLALAEFAEPVRDVACCKAFPLEGKLELQQLFLYRNPVQSVEDAAAGRMIYNVIQYGAVSDGSVVMTEILQRTIDLCSRNGGGIVYFPAGIYLSGMIQIRDRVELYLERNAVLKGILDMEVYPAMESEKTRNWNMLRQGPRRALVYADNVENIVIQGGGTIDGSGDFPGHYGSEPERPSAIELVGCGRASIRNLHVKDAGMWTIPLIECDHFYMRDVDIDSRWFPNRDGIDLCDCHHVLVENCSIVSDDDAICFKSGHERGCRDNVVRQVMAASIMANGIKFGTYSYGGFFDCTLSDCVVKDTRLCAMCVEIVDGGQAENLNFNRISVSNTGSAFFVVLGDRGNIPDWGEHRIGGIHAVCFSDIMVEGLKKTHGSYIGGLYKDGREYRVEQVRFRRVKARFKGGLAEKPEEPREYDSPRYPEDNMFGNLPASAYYVRHGDVSFEQCMTEIAEPDLRDIVHLGAGGDIFIK